MIDRAGLADFLRRRRELLRPANIGLADTVRRRTPGLRRDEVAQLANISTDYYARLEQCRGANPSETIVAALARALHCDLGAVMDRSSRELLWGQVPVGQALLLLSCMLRDLDLKEVPEAQVEAGWAARLPGEAALRARAAIAKGRRLLPPQFLLVAVGSATRCCDVSCGCSLSVHARW